MKYEQMKRRCQNALRDAIETKNEAAADAIRSILESLDAGPLKPGDVVDTENYAKRIDCMIGKTGIVRACWFDANTGKHWATVESDAAFATATVDWFPTLATAPTNEGKTDSCPKYQELRRVAERVVEIFRPMQNSGRNGDTFCRLLERAENALGVKFEPTPVQPGRPTINRAEPAPTSRPAETESTSGGAVAEREFLIWSNEHSAYWKPDGNGYTGNRNEAGRYTLAHAIKIAEGANRSTSPVVAPFESIVPA